jgi:hypothetical protein
MIVTFLTPERISEYEVPVFQIDKEKNPVLFKNRWEVQL